uniref:Alpha-galactosidase NEW3 domain-containing protein n=1 Tax=Caldilinea aerophila TaxID=133453 RepID=A0A7C1FQ74_9CHLR
MRKLQLSLALLVLTALLFMPLAAYAQEAAQAEPTPTPQPLTIFTSYPSQVVGMDETVTLALKVRAGEPQVVQLSVEDAPTGWNLFFRGGGRTVSSVFVDGKNDASVDLRLEPAGAEPGTTHSFTVVATGSTGQVSRLPIQLTVQEKAPPALSLTSELPVLRGKATTTFRFNVTLKNEGTDDMNVNLTADAPPFFLVTFTLNAQDVTSVPLNGGESKRLTVEARALNNIPAAAYPIVVNAQGNDVSASLNLTAEVVGQPELSLTTPDGRLSGEANAGRTTSFKLVVSNTGSAPARNVTLSSSAPSGWNITLEPKEIAAIEPGQTVEVTAQVQPAEKAINGDYVVTFTVRGDEVSSKSIDFRVTVTTSTLWGIAGVALIAVAVGVVALAVGRFGRR